MDGHSIVYQCDMESRLYTTRGEVTEIIDRLVVSHNLQEVKDGVVQTAKGIGATEEDAMRAALQEIARTTSTDMSSKFSQDREGNITSTMDRTTAEVNVGLSEVTTQVKKVKDGFEVTVRALVMPLY